MKRFAISLWVRCFVRNWASEVSPTLGCSIEISRDIYPFVCLRMAKCVGEITWPKCVGGITWPKHVHAQSVWGARWTHTAHAHTHA